MSGAFPTSPEPNSIDISSTQTTFVSDTMNGRRQVRQIQDQRWQITASFPPMLRAKFNEVFAFVVSQRGVKGTFTFTPPIIDDALGTETGSVLVNGVHAVGDTTIAMDAFGADGAGRFKAGDFIKFAGHTKVYMVVADVTSSSNAATVTIEPPLTTALANNEAVTYDNVAFTVALVNDIQTIALGGDGFYRFEVDMIEVI